MAGEALPIALARLISDPAFQRFALLQEQPNFFRAVARSHTEKWHTAFLGWLLDPSGSHSLGGFPLQRFTAALSNFAVPPDDDRNPLLTPNELAHASVSKSFSEALTLPNERAHQEKTIDDGRVDVWLELEATEEDGQGLLAIIEVKVDAGLSNNQSKKYADHLIKAATLRESRALLVFIAREEDIGETSEETVGDRRWYCLGFQSLHDYVLIPCLEHPLLSQHMRPLLEHYLINMRTDDRGRGRMAATKDEKTLALEIYEKHRDTFIALGSLLKQEEGFLDVAADADAPEELSIKIVGGPTLSGDKVSSFFTAVFDYVYKTKKLRPALPINSGRKRYLLAVEPRHPSGSEFFNAKEYAAPGGHRLFFEANISRPNALTTATKFLKNLGIDVA